MDSNDVDIVENGAIVKVFLLEAALPFNAPKNVRDAAGPFWESYALTHAALGFLVEESESKHTIEFYATDYLGSFLPHLPPPPPTPAPTTPPPVLTISPTAAPTATSPTSAPLGTTAPTAVVSPPPVTVAPVTPSPIVPSRDIYSYVSNGLAAGGGGGGGGSEGRKTRRGESGGRHLQDEDASGGRGTEVEENAREWQERRQPLAAAGNGTVDITWSNAGAVQFSRGFDPNLWVSANYVAKITGLLYNDLSGWSSDFNKKHPAYKPLSACGGSDGTDDKRFQATGSANSYDFVWSAFEHLASNGVIFEREVILPPKRTAMCLFAKGDDASAVEFVSTEGNDEAVEYYRRTNKCVEKLAAAAAAGNATYPGGGACTSRAIERKKSASAGSRAGSSSTYADGEAEGAVSLLLGLGGCLEGESHAFLYHNESAFMRLPLPGSPGDNDTLSLSSNSNIVGARKSGIIPTAGLVRYTPAMPPRPPAPPGGSDRAWIVYVAVALGAAAFAFVVARAIFKRKQRAEMLAYGEGGERRGGGSLFSSQAGAGWRSGGRDAAGSDFGEFDSAYGGGYGGPMFPGDSYGSASFGGMSGGSGQGRRSWRGSGRERSGGGGQSSSSLNSGENVELKRPLLSTTESPLREVPPPGRSVSPPPGGRSSGMMSSGRNSSFSGGRGRTTGKTQTGGSSSSGRFSRHSDELSPPPFARVHGTIGAGPAVSRGAKGAGGGERRSQEESAEAEVSSGGGKLDDGADETERGPFGDDPFVGGRGRGGSRGSGGGGGSGDDDGDEVFC